MKSQNKDKTLLNQKSISLSNNKQNTIYFFYF